MSFQLVLLIAFVVDRSNATELMPDGTPKRTLGDRAKLLGVYSGRTSDESDLGFVGVMEYVNEICRDGT
jgi:hypothetical protein